MEKLKKGLEDLRTFLKESWVEVRHKVTWPTSQEVWGTTLVVILTTLAFAALLFAVDGGLAIAVKKVFDSFRGEAASAAFALASAWA